MKKFKFGKITALLLSGTMLFSATACAGTSKADLVLMEEGVAYELTEKGTPVAYDSHTFSITGGPDVMPIGGFHGPYKSGGSLNGNDLPNMLDEKYVAALSEAGINVIVYMGTRQEWASKDIEEVLKLGDKYGMGFYLNLLYLEQIIGSRNPAPIGNINKQELYNRIVNACYGFKYESMLGFQLIDELFPTNQLKNAIKVADTIREFGLPIDLYSNAHGYFAGNSFNWFGLSNYTYDEYVEEFKEMQLKVFSNTLYPYETANGPSDDDTRSTLQELFSALRNARETAYNNGMAFWRMMAAGHQWAGMVESLPYAPSEGEFMFDANASLLFGAKGLQFYTCMQYPGEGTLPDGSYDSHRNGLIGVNGSKTQWWHYLKKLTNQIFAADHILMNSASMGFIPYGEEAEALCKGIQGSSVLLEEFRQLDSISGDSCFVGCFDYKGGSAYMAMNASRNNRAEVTLSFDGNYGYDVIQRGVQTSVVGTTMSLMLQPGEAVVIALR